MNEWKGYIKRSKSSKRGKKEVKKAIIINGDLQKSKQRWPTLGKCQEDYNLFT